MYYNSYNPNRCPTGTTSYVVKAGDTLFSIAMRHNTTVANIVAVNPGIDPNLIHVGQVICIPMSQPPCPGGNYYTIRAGDTFFTIARIFNVSLDALLAANPGVDPDALHIGQVICIPGAVPPPVTCPAGTMPYTIQAGDTFFTIARKHNVSLDQLLAANPNINPDNLIVGQTICIPGGTPVPPPPLRCPVGTTAYTIKSGDTFYLLAQRFNTTVEAIQQLNPQADPNNLQIGQIICIPGSGPTPPPSGCPTGTTPYTIKSGDTFFLLAQRFNTTVEAIQRANPGVNPNNLQIGQVICIPGSGGTTPPPSGKCPAGTTPYTIKSGDTFFLLAKRFNTTVEAIEKANPGVDPNRLQIGQVICMPSGKK